MAKKPDKRKPDDPEQSKRFEETARGADVSENAEAFERALESIALKVPKKRES